MTDRATLEREIEAERAGLRDAVQALDARLSPQHIIDQAADLLQQYGAEAAEAALKSAKDNPMAVALMGAGLAWFVAGATLRKDDTGDHPARPLPVASQPRPSLQSRLPPGPAEPRHSTPAAVARFTPRHGVGAVNSPREETTMSTSNHEPGFDPKGRLDRAQDRMATTASKLRERITSGIDHLPDAARERILAARLAAIDAQAAIEARTQRATDAARRNMQDNPLMIGALVMAVGAAIGASLPRTSVENRAIGERRDRLFEEAERLFHEETARLRKTAEAAVSEGKAALHDALTDGPDDDGEGPVARVSRAAREEAERQKSGSVS